MKRRAFAPWLALALALAACRGSQSAAPEAGAPVSPRPIGESVPTPRWTAKLYFPGPGALLHIEERALEVGERPEDRARKIAEALLAGPQAKDLSAPLEATQAKTVYLAPDGVLYLDLASPDHPAPPATGSTGEILTVFSLVDSLALNLPAVRGVVLLWNGTQLESFGHLDTTHALRPDSSLISQPGSNP